MKTQKSLFMSVVSLLLCVSMLVGSTFAWFTDSVSSGSNVITSGNLDLEVQYTLDGKNWKDLNGAKDLFQKGLWEPGHTEVVALKVSNVGSLALKYVASMKIFQEAVGKTKDGKDIVLSDILTVSTLTQQANAFGDIALMLAYMGENKVGYETTSSFKATNVLGQEKELLPGDAHYVFIKVDMAETVGNEANHDGVHIPTIDFGINVLASQFAYENDSFGNQYDKDATFDDFANTSILATETKTLVAGEDSVEFDLSNEGLKIANVSVPADAILDPTKPVTVTFDGIEPQITGENIVGYAYDIKVTNLKSNLTEDQMVTVVVEAPNALAAMQAYHNGVLIEDAVYDEVAGTITFKTASFSPYEFKAEVIVVDTLEELRDAVKQSNVEIKLMAPLTIDLTDGSADRSEDHVLVSSKKYYNAVNIIGENVAIDLNGQSITVKCSNTYNGNQDVGALFYVNESGSLNIVDRADNGFIKMASSIYMVWAPYETPSYVDIYSGAFIGDSYANDPIGTSTNPGSADGTMQNENSNRALIYAGKGGNMNIYGGYFLYNNTPNDVLNRNNGAFNCTNGYEGDRPFITIHDGVMLSDKAYRQDPTHTNEFQNILKENPNAQPTDEGIMDNSSIKLAKHCEVVQTTDKTTVAGITPPNGWYRVTRKEVVDLSIDATTLYAVGQELNINKVTVKYNFGDDKVLSADDYTVSGVDMSFGGKKLVTVTYTEFGKTISTNITVTVSEDFSTLIATPEKNVYDLNDTVNIKVVAIADDGTRAEVTGASITGADTSKAGIKTVTVSFGGKTTTCEIKVRNTTSLDGNTDQQDEHALFWYFNHQFKLGGIASASNHNYNDYIGKTFTGSNGETATGFNNDFAGTYAHSGSPNGGNAIIRGKNQYGLTVNNALPYTYIGIHCIAGYDAKLIGFGYYVDGNVTTLDYTAPMYYSDKVLTDPGYQGFIDLGGQYTAEASVDIALSTLGFAAGTTHTVTWVAVFEDGYQKLADWKITMKSSFGDDNYYQDTEKTDINVIVLSGQSNAAGATPITQADIEKYGNVNYKNVYMQYKNVYTNDGINVYTKNENAGFEKYYFGMGGYYDTTFGPDAALAKYLATTPGLMDEQWFIIKYAAPGTNLDLHWQQNANLTQKMMDYVQECVNDLTNEGYDVKITSLLWMQGENDALAKECADRYAQNEQNMVSAFRTKFAKYATRPNANIPGSGIAFIDAGIAPAGKDGNEWLYAATVNDAKVKNAYIWYVPGVAPTNSPVYPYVGAQGGSFTNPSEAGIYNSCFIDTSLMSAQATDPAHYDQQSMEWLGIWFAQYVDGMRNVVLPTPPETSEPIKYTITVQNNASNYCTITGIQTGDQAAPGDVITFTLKATTRRYFTVTDSYGNTLYAKTRLNANGTATIELEMQAGDVTVTITQSQW